MEIAEAEATQIERGAEGEGTVTIEIGEARGYTDHRFDRGRRRHGDNRETGVWSWEGCWGEGGAGGNEKYDSSNPITTHSVE